MKIFAAGSLRGPLSEICNFLEKEMGQKIVTELGPSGLLRNRIEKGENVDLFFSADTSHCQHLVDRGNTNTIIPICRNELCLFGFIPQITSLEKIIKTMLDPKLKLGTSTPGDDPGGDYAFNVFTAIDAFQPGSYSRLSEKSLQLVGGKHSDSVPKGIHPVLYLFEQQKVDIFLGYLTSAIAVQASIPEITIVSLPKPLSQIAQYTALKIQNSDAQTDSFLDFILSTDGISIFKKHGFKT